MANTKICDKCKNEVPETARFCNKCRHTGFTKAIKCSCGMLIPENVNFCLSCGKKINLSAKIKMKKIHASGDNLLLHKCNICIQKIEFDLVVCPSCLNTFHFNHLANWIIKSSSCPICKVKLELSD